jgi:hypothetical protein
MDVLEVSHLKRLNYALVSDLWGRRPDATGMQPCTGDSICVSSDMNRTVDLQATGQVLGSTTRSRGYGGSDPVSPATTG